MAKGTELRIMSLILEPDASTVNLCWVLFKIHPWRGLYSCAGRPDRVGTYGA
jgi:hypothetical protein